MLFKTGIFLAHSFFGNFAFKFSLSGGVVVVVLFLYSKFCIEMKNCAKTNFATHKSSFASSSYTKCQLREPIDASQIMDYNFVSSALEIENYHT
jgi:hypothetical protein